MGDRAGAVEALVNGLTPSFWRGRRVLVTGHTGFKGAWLVLWLARLGARVSGLALPPATRPALYSAARIDSRMQESVMADLRDASAVRAAVAKAAPEVVLHLAAQPLVRAGYREPVETFAVNLLGTVHLLEALRSVPGLLSVVAVTTDKVYRDRRWPYPYREQDALGGHDPYSASKAAAELAIDCYRDSFFSGDAAPIATARAGNVIGGGDWSEDRLLPDAVRAWASGAPLRLRRPDAVRPWQHVLEPLFGYLTLAQRLADDRALQGAWNFGPDPQAAYPVRQVVELAQAPFGGGQVVCDSTPEGPHETAWLSLETAKSRVRLGLRPRWSTEVAVQRTMRWYRQQLDGADARALCEADIDAYEAAASALVEPAA